MRLADAFNRSSFGRLINQPAGRAFRLTAGAAFLVGGLLSRHTLGGLLSIGWSVFPLTAGGLDVCYVSALLGGPLSGKTIRAQLDAGSSHRKAPVLPTPRAG
jgi:hypothetical protein